MNRQKRTNKKTIFTISLCFGISCSAFAQENYKKLADSLRYVTDVPYIENCNDSVFWKIVRAGKPIVPHLIDKMTDTRDLEKDVYVRFFGGKYTVADIAYVAIQEIIAGIPTFEHLGVPVHEECGYCSYWYYVRESKKNRKKFQKAVRNWYEENKDYLIWWESSHSVTGDCFIAPTKGHYIVRHKIFDDFPPLRELQCGLWINNNGTIALKEIGCEFNEESVADTTFTIHEWKPIDQYLTWVYNIYDTIPENISDEEFALKFQPSLKEVVDTASFKILSRFFFMDKNFIYSYTPMACGGHIFVWHGLDRETFSVFEENPDYACDKNGCYVMSMDIKNADPETFQPIIINGEPTWYSKDKNHIYDVNEPMSEAKIIELEKELGIKFER